MRSFSLLTLLCLGLSSAVLAQPGPSRETSERMEALRIAFMTERLSLTPDESKAFWPMHEGFEAQMETQREAMRTLKDAFDAASASDAELQKFVHDLAEQRKSMVDLESEHVLAVAELLGAERALKLPEMKRELARNIRERMDATNRKGPPGPRQGHSPRSTRSPRME
ncbi:MAG: hypothetical protein P8H88_08615 [Flavobacteriales bacterium]|nr:hypothetical protein [Flavobacteriales bacterium]